MPTKYEYDIIMGNYIDVKKGIDYRINNGWELQGGIIGYYNIIERNGQYAQAIIKKTEIVEEN